MIREKILIIGNSDYLKPITKILDNKKKNYCRVGLKNFSKNINKLNFDYSDKKKTLSFAKKNKTTYIIPDANDVSYLTSSYVANKLKISGYEPYKISNLLINKKKFYIFCKKNKISIPNFFFGKKKEFIKNKPKLPYLIKPERSYSGIGIKKIKKYSDLDNLKDKKYLFTEFKKGQLFSCSCFLDNGKIKKSYFVKEYCINYPYTVDFSKIENNKNTKFKKKILNELNKLIKLLNIKSGLMHCQFIKNKKKNYIIEVTRRLPGDFYNELIKLSYGNNNYINNYVNNFISEKFSLEKNNFQKSLRKNFFNEEKFKLKKILNNYKIFEQKKFFLKNNTNLSIDFNNKKKYVFIAKYK